MLPALLGGALCLSTADWQPTTPTVWDIRLRRASATYRNHAAQIDLDFRRNAGTLRSPWNPRSTVRLNRLVALQLRDGRTLDLQPIAPIVSRESGLNTDVVLRDREATVEVTFQVMARPLATYVRTRATIKPLKGDLDLARVTLVDVSGPGAEVNGTVLGSPITGSDWFAGTEHPMAESSQARGSLQSFLPRKVSIKQGTSVTLGAVFGVAPPGQLRRAFLAYLEDSRPRPYSPFLHYNSWYDLGFFTKFNEAECVERIRAYTRELREIRGVALQSFLFDDGWDDTSTVWSFHSGFPNGFAPLRDAAALAGGAPGMWLSPWGGYGRPRQERLATGKAAGMEIDDQGYALSGPRYYERFREVCLRAVQKDGVNQFKFDGTGSPDKQVPGSRFDSDFAAAIELIHDLREAKPGLFVNLTTGTWPSPFWTQIADSIWRGGSDHSFAGDGTQRQRWITYRDADTYRGVVRQGPLYPLNSLMLHGLIYAKHANGLNADPGNDFRDEVRSYFASGTQLQELYITPELLTSQNWDDLAEAARWSKYAAGVLRDVHWIGGDPGKSEVYGWAAWTPKRSIVTLRNPAAHAQAYALTLRDALELPPAIRGRFAFQRPWRSEAGEPALTLDADVPTVIVLKPFQVLTLDGGPQS